MKEIKKEKEKQKNKSRKRTERLLICVLLMIIVILLLFRCSGNQNEEVSEYEQEVNAITEIDYSQYQEALNAIVEEGKMNVNYSSTAIFEGASSLLFNIKNIKNNHYPIVFELYDEKENKLYTSKQIKPGYEMNQNKLEQIPSKGVHEGKLKVGYAEGGNVSAVFPIVIEVK